MIGVLATRNNLRVKNATLSVKKKDKTQCHEFNKELHTIKSVYQVSCLKSDTYHKRRDFLCL